MSLHTNTNSETSTNVSVPSLKNRPSSKSRKLEKVETSEPQLIDGRPPANSPATWALGLDWPVVIWIAVVHAFAFAAPFFFTWQALVACIVLILATGSLGV